MNKREALTILTGNQKDLSDDSLVMRMTFLLTPVATELLKHDEECLIMETYATYLETLLLQERIDHDNEIKGYNDSPLHWE